MFLENEYPDIKLLLCFFCFFCKRDSIISLLLKEFISFSMSPDKLYTHYCSGNCNPGLRLYHNPGGLPA